MELQQLEMLVEAEVVIWGGALLTAGIWTWRDGFWSEHEVALGLALIQIANLSNHISGILDPSYRPLLPTYKPGNSHSP